MANKRFADKPRKYELKPRAKFDANWLPILQNLAGLGYTEADIGMILGHTGDQRQFIKNMQRGHDEAKNAIQTGRQMANMALVAQAFKAACGYDYEESLEETDAEGNVVRVKKFKKHQKPEPALLQFLLCNRMGDEFTSVHKIEVNKTENSSHLNIEATADQINELGGKLLEMANDRKKIESKVVDGSE